MVSNKRGRPALAGARTPSGRLKPADDRGNLIWHRIKADGLRFGLDPRLGTQLSRLCLLRELTDTQAEAGFLIARIYQQFERWHGQRRATGQAAYAKLIANPEQPSPKGAKLRERDEARDEQSMQKADRRMATLQREINALPLATSEARNVLEAFCVDDQAPSGANLPSIRSMLDRIAVRFGLTAQATSAPASVAITARQFPRRRAVAALRKRHVDKDAWMETARQLRPDATDAQLEESWRGFMAARDHGKALQDRERFRASKQRRRA